MANSSQYDIIASAIVRRLASPTRVSSPSRVASPSINRLASAIASELRAKPRIASPAAARVNPNLVASAVVQQLASPTQYAPESLASIIASRLSSPARSSIGGGAVNVGEIDFESLADRVARRPKDDAAGSAKATTDLLASAITQRLTKPTLRLSRIEFEELVSKAADAINRKLAPSESPVSQLGTDTVDASQALKGDADRKSKKRAE